MGDKIVIRIDQAQVDRLSREIGEGLLGGFQQLLARLQHGITPDETGGMLRMSIRDAQRVVHYAQSYRKGTYQSQLQQILPQVEQALRDNPPPPPPLQLFEEEGDDA